MMAISARLLLLIGIDRRFGTKIGSILDTRANNSSNAISGRDCQQRAKKRYISFPKISYRTFCKSDIAHDRACCWTNSRAGVGRVPGGGGVIRDRAGVVSTGAAPKKRAPNFESSEIELLGCLQSERTR